MSMTTSCFAITLSFLKQLETDWDLDVRQKAQIQTLRLKAGFLKALFSCTGKIDAINLKVLLGHIQTVILKVDKDLQVLWSELNQIPSKEYQRIPADLYVLASSSLLKLEMINPDIQDVYSALSNSTRLTCSTMDAVIESFDVLLEYLKDLMRYKSHSVVPVKKEIEALEDKLRHRRNFLGITKRWCDDHEELKDFLTQTEAVADNMACLLYLCSEDCKMEENIVNEMKTELSYQLQKLNPFHLDVREKYMKALKALKSAGQSVFLVDEHVLGFLDSLLANTVELPDFKASSLLAIDQLEYLHEELKILRYFLMDPSAEKYIENHPKVSSIFLQMKRVVCEAACVIYSSYDHNITEGITRKQNLAITDLLQQFKLIKLEARDTYDELIPKSLRSNFHKTNELGFIDFVSQKLKELLSSKNDSIDQLRHHIETVYQNILSFRGDITEAREQFIEQELEDPWKRFKDIVYHTDYVIDSFILRDEPLWYHKLGLFDIIEEISIIKVEVNWIKENTMANLAAPKFSLNVGGASSSEANSETMRLQVKLRTPLTMWSCLRMKLNR